MALAGDTVLSRQSFAAKSIVGTPGAARNAMLLLIAATGLLRLIEAASIGLVTGEAYYLASARELHLSYFDQPPLSLWVIWATRALFQSEAPVLLRLPFILMFAASTWMIYRIGARLHSEWAGVVAAVVMNGSILFTVSIGTWLQPDAPLILFWLAACWVLIDIFFDAADERPYWKWAWAGIWLGLAALSKYHAIFLVVGAAAFAVTHRPARRWLIHPGPYFALVLAMVIVLPVLAWNAQHGWASFVFQAGRALGDGIHPQWLLRMIVGQLLFIAPWIALPALAAGVRAAMAGRRGAFPDGTQQGFAWFLFWMGIGPIAFFTAVAAVTDPEGHFHWQAPGYLMWFPLLGAWAASAWNTHAGLVRTWLAASAAASLLAFAILVSHTATGWVRFAAGLGPGVPDPTVAALKWTGLGDWLEQSGTLRRPRSFVAGLSWDACGHVDTPVAGRLPVACLTDDPRNLAFNTHLGEMDGWTGYLVVTPAQQSALAALADHFEALEPLATFDVTRGGIIEIPGISIVRARGLKLDRDLPAAGQHEIDIVRLPRTRIAGLRGRISLPESAGETAILLDGAVVGVVTPEPDGVTDFILSVDAAATTLGLSTATATLEPSGAVGPGEVVFIDLAVTLR